MRQSNYSDRLRLMLNNLGCSQRQLAATTGMTESAICHYLQGTREPHANQLIKIADKTHVSPAWILGYGPDEPMQKV